MNLRYLPFAVLVFQVVCHAQEYTEGELFTGSGRDLLSRSISERELLMQYNVECVVKGRLGDLSGFRKGWKTSENSTTIIRFEYSRIDDHYVVALRDASARNSSETWEIMGRSGGFGIVGSSDGKLIVRDLNSPGRSHFLEVPPDRTQLRVFDPRIVGLTFCVEFFNGFSLESHASQMLDSLRKRKPGTDVVSSNESGHVEWQKSGDTKIVFDAVHEFWPIKLDYRWGEVGWETDLQEFEGMHVPEKSTLTCSKKDKTTIEFKWKMINKPIEPGRASAIRLAEEYNCEISR